MLAWSAHSSLVGLDGLTAEFYKEFWPDFGHFVISVFNEAFVKSELCPSQRESVMSLIYKKGERENIANYRPISLFNTDKILAFIMSRRMQEVLCSVIDDDRTGYIKGRFIGQNIRLVSDIIENNKYKNGIFMFESLKLFNFGPMFCQWIKTMYTNPVFCLKNNEYLSSRITMERGIRQGCPVSALLFILVVEVLAINIRENKNIHGLEAVFMHKKNI